MSNPETYSVTLEHGTDGTTIAWVHELPGCAVRAASRDDVLERLPTAIADFVAWSGTEPVSPPQIAVVAEVDAAVRTEEDTEVLVDSDREPFSADDWRRVAPLLARSRAELADLLARLPDDALESKRPGSERTVREEIEHVAFVELMYVAWTFDLQSRDGLSRFLDWTRAVATARMRELGEDGADEVTWARWAGAPQPEPWTARKAARRLVWHELLHLRAIERR